MDRLQKVDNFNRGIEKFAHRPECPIQVIKLAESIKETKTEIKRLDEALTIVQEFDEHTMIHFNRFVEPSSLATLSEMKETLDKSFSCLARRHRENIFVKMHEHGKEEACNPQMAMESVDVAESPRFLTPTRKTFATVARTPKPEPNAFTPIETDESELHMTPNVMRPQSRNSYIKAKP